jgi:hypothetical protein
MDNLTGIYNFVDAAIKRIHYIKCVNRLLEQEKSIVFHLEINKEKERLAREFFQLLSKYEHTV